MNEKENKNLKEKNSSDYCNSCVHLKFIPDSTDIFKNNEKKVICMAKKVVMYRSLKYNELTQIPKPLYCPKLGREITDEEDLIAMKQLEAARLN